MLSSRRVLPSNLPNHRFVGQYFKALLSPIVIRDEVSGRDRYQVLLKETGLEIRHKNFGNGLVTGKGHVHDSLKCQKIDKQTNKKEPIINSERKMYKLPTII